MAKKEKTAPGAAPTALVVLAATRLNRLNETQRAAAVARARRRLEGKHHGKRDTAIAIAVGN